MFHHLDTCSVFLWSSRKQFGLIFSRRRAVCSCSSCSIAWRRQRAVLVHTGLEILNRRFKSFGFLSISICYRVKKKYVQLDDNSPLKCDDRWDFSILRRKSKGNIFFGRSQFSRLVLPQRFIAFYFYFFDQLYYLVTFWTYSSDNIKKKHLTCFSFSGRASFEVLVKM